MEIENKANFFVVGAAKSGTTSIYHYLKSHNDIYLSPIKEPHYFSTDIKIENFSSTYLKHTFLDLESYFAEKPYPELALSFVKKKEHYAKLFEDWAGEKAIGECSPSYLYSDVAAKNIFEFNKDAKIIISLRNPIKRAFSHYLMALRLGHTHHDFRQAFENDLNKNPKGWGTSELFYELGLYSSQIEKFKKYFPDNQIKIVLFEDLKSNTNKLIMDIHEFLGVEKMEIGKAEKHNAAFIPRNPLFNQIMVNTGLKNLVSNIVGDKTKDKMKSVFFDKDNIGEINEEDKNYLREIYREDILKTSKLIDKDLSFWLEA